MLLINLLCHILGLSLNREGDAFCLANLSVVCVWINATLNLTAKYDTVPSHETRYFADLVNMKKSASLVV